MPVKPLIQSKEALMREPNALISIDALARDLSAGDLRVFDCTTYLEPPPPGSDDPYIAVPGQTSFETAHIPSADFLDLQGEFSDNTTRLCFMMPAVEQLEAAFGRHGIGAVSRVVLYSIVVPTVLATSARCNCARCSVSERRVPPISDAVIMVPSQGWAIETPV
jgi:3-mercaptopyruvate sulfurtransferase SseA